MSSRSSRGFTFQRGLELVIIGWTTRWLSASRARPSSPKGKRHPEVWRHGGHGGVSQHRLARVRAQFLTGGNGENGDFSKQAVRQCGIDVSVSSVVSCWHFISERRDHLVVRDHGRSSVRSGILVEPNRKKCASL